MQNQIVINLQKREIFLRTEEKPYQMNNLRNWFRIHAVQSTNNLLIRLLSEIETEYTFATPLNLKHILMCVCARRIVY